MSSPLPDLVEGVAPAAAPISEQGAVTQWPLRILLVLLTLAVIALAMLMLRRGWQARGRRQPFDKDLLDDNGLTAALAGQPAVAGKYVGTITAGHPLDRVIAAGGVAAAQVRVGAGGIRIDRAGGDPLVIPTAAVTDVTTTPGMLQRFYGRHGVLLVSWDWDGREVSTGLWFVAADEQAEVRRRIETAIGHQPIGREAS